MLKKILPFVIFLSGLMFSSTPGQKFSVSKIEPPNWWAGMKLNKIQLMVYGQNLGGVSASFNNPEIKVLKINSVDNHSYSFIDIEIPEDVIPGNYSLVFKKDKTKKEIPFPVLKRTQTDESLKGFNSSDVIYLIMPDRFCNGDTSNDNVKGYDDPFNKIKNQNRFGGDIKGIINKLEYLKNLGVSCLWLTPLVENNTFRSYHGYAATDFYRIDPRLGSNALYTEMVKKAHEKGISVILDHVSNHFSDDHPWIKNLPAPDWINGTITDHLNANHQKMEFTDPYADSSTIKHIEQGWFTNEMPDLNQNNPFVANYIIQNTIWWIESADLDGIREDTYPYNNQRFMAKWAETILNEYPSINIVGEVWTGDPAFLAGYQKDTFLPRSFNTNLPALTDFGLRDVFVSFLQGRSKLNNVFELLSKDYLYKYPENLVTFADNHDVGRVMYYANGNIKKAEIVYTLLLTTRGIPALFYGSEIGMVGSEDHGELRIPFPGGFKGEGRNAFTKEGRTDYENKIFDFLSGLLLIRKNHPSLYSGRLVHFPPENNAYIYFRTSEDEKLMIVINGNDSSAEINLKRAGNLLNPDSKLLNLQTGAEIILTQNMNLKLDGLKAEIYKIIE